MTAGSDGDPTADVTADGEPVVAASAPVHDWGASTSRGLVRRENEDAWAAFETSLFAVADGMGGRPGGALAARTAVRGLVSMARTVGFDGDWRRTVRLLNVQVRTAAAAGGLPRAGTALVAGSLGPARTTIVHVGDARAYLLRVGRLTAFTRDHTVEAELRRAGVELSDPDRRRLPLFALTRHLGGPDDRCVPDVTSFVPEQGDRLLLATDGVARQLRPDEIADALTPRAGTSCTEVAHQLTGQADAAGGRDNATALVIEFASRAS